MAAELTREEILQSPVLGLNSGGKTPRGRVKIINVGHQAEHDSPRQHGKDEVHVGEVSDQDEGEGEHEEKGHKKEQGKQEVVLDSQELGHFASQVLLITK